MGPYKAQIDADGFLFLPNLFTDAPIFTLRELLADALDPSTSRTAVRHRAGAVYAARNILSLCPELAHRWKHPSLMRLLTTVLGAEAGLLRGLFFDKPPDQTWALPWHKDMTVAVRDDGALPKGFSKRRLRDGIPHSEAPAEVLEQLLTLRIHLDDVTEENGPLKVLAGSHRSGKTLAIHGYREQTITGPAGSVLAMRPLLTHSSGRSVPGTARHRRILHLEFAARETAAPWHTWMPIACENVR